MVFLERQVNGSTCMKRLIPECREAIRRDFGLSPDQQAAAVGVAKSRKKTKRGSIILWTEILFCKTRIVEKETALAFARMKKVFIVGLGEDKEKVLRFLQDVGVVHVEPFAKPSSEAEEQNTHIVQNVRRIGQIYESLKGYRSSGEEAEGLISEEEILLRSERALEDLQEVRSRKQALVKIIADLGLWGDFDTNYLAGLEKENVFVQRFRAEGMSHQQLDIPDDAFIQIVAAKPVLQFFTVRLGSPVELPWATPCVARIRVRRKQEKSCLSYREGITDCQ